MDALSITVYANNRPVLTRGVKSVQVIDRPAQEPALVNAVQAPEPAAPSGPLDPGRAIGPAAQEALVRSNDAATQTEASSAASSAGAASANGLTPEEQDVVDQLAARDREVRRHEEAHARVGGQYAGQPSYDYELGPDGRRYAVGGQVPIDVAPIPDDPEATIDKMDIVKKAALAPAEPSAADRQIAALADAQRLAAVVELNAQKTEERLSYLRQNDLAEQAKGLSLGPASEPGQILSLAA